MNSFFTNFASGMANSPMLKGSVLGSLIGAAPGVAQKFQGGGPTGQAPQLTGATIDAQTGQRTPGAAFGTPMSGFTFPSARSQYNQDMVTE